MIEGVVNSAYEAIVTLSLRGPEGQIRAIDAVIDTGYNGFLTLPTAVVAELGLAFGGISRATLADGSVVAFDVYDVTVLWDGIARHVSANAADSTPLVGMSLLDRHDLNIRVRDGGHVLIQATVEQ